MATSDSSGWLFGFCTKENNVDVVHEPHCDVSEFLNQKASTRFCEKFITTGPSNYR